MIKKLLWTQLPERKRQFWTTGPCQQRGGVGLNLFIFVHNILLLTIFTTNFKCRTTAAAFAFIN